jgi:hypothetical protein
MACRVASWSARTCTDSLRAAHPSNPASDWAQHTAVRSGRSQPMPAGGSHTPLTWPWHGLSTRSERQAHSPPQPVPSGSARSSPVREPGVRGQPTRPDDTALPEYLVVVISGAAKPCPDSCAAQSGGAQQAGATASTATSRPLQRRCRPDPIGQRIRPREPSGCRAWTDMDPGPTRSRAHRQDLATDAAPRLTSAGEQINSTGPPGRIGPEGPERL